MMTKDMFHGSVPALLKLFKRRTGAAVFGAVAGWRTASELDGGFLDLNAIFVHIPKAAGSSIALALYGHQVGHGAIMDCYVADYARTKSCFKFAFVRDPLDRLISAYQFLRSGGMNAQDRMFAQRHLMDGDFETFVEALRKDRKLRRHLHFRPQYEFVSSPARPRHMLVDFVGRFETLDQDFSYVCSRIGREIKLPVRNARSAKPSSLIGSHRTRDLVREIYALDYEVFGYD